MNAVEFGVQESSLKPNTLDFWIWDFRGAALWDCTIVRILRHYPDIKFKNWDGEFL